MKKFSFLLIVLFCITSFYAQNTFQKGYLVDNSGTKKICYIKNLDWRTNPTKFDYKITEESTEISEGKISEYQEFAIDDNVRFVRRSVNIERSDYNNLNNLSHSKKPAYKLETLYLKFLIKGAATLYTYRENDVIKYFYETELVPLEQLIYFKYLDNTSTSGLVVKENTQFRQQLFNNVRCENEQSEDFRKINFHKNELVKIFEKYNLCHKTDTIEKVNYDKRIKRKAISLKATLGVYNAKLSNSGSVHYYNVDTDSKKMLLKIGLDFEYILPYNNGSWSVVVNPSYHHFSSSKKFRNDNGYGQDVDYDLKVKYSNLELPIGLRRYFHISPSSKIFINGMYVININGESSTIAINNELNGPNGKGYYLIQPTNNLSVGAGYTYKKFSAEIRFYTESNLTKYERLSSKYNTFGINFGYAFL